MEDLAGVLAITLSLSIPIITIIGFAIVGYKKKQADFELRRLIIVDGVDKETAELLLKEAEKEKGKDKTMFNNLRGGAMLFCAGLGMLAYYLLHINGLVPADIQSKAFVLFMVLGAGLGLLVAFGLEWHLRKKHPAEEQEQQ